MARRRARAAPPAPKPPVRPPAASRRAAPGAPAAELMDALLEAAIGGDADATGALCALVEAEPPLPRPTPWRPTIPSWRSRSPRRTPPRPTDARIVSRRAPDAAGGARRGADGARLARRREPARGPRPGRRRHAAQRRFDLHGRAVAFLDALPGPVVVAPPRRRPPRRPSCAPPRRAADAHRAKARSFEDRDDATFNRLYHAGPCLYQLALALDETDVTEGELASAPWLRSRRGGRRGGGGGGFGSLLCCVFFKLFRQWRAHKRTVYLERRGP